MKKHKSTIKKTARQLADLAIHVWVLLLLANVLLVYTFHFFLHAAGPQSTSSLTPSPSTIAEGQSTPDQSSQNDSSSSDEPFLDQPIPTNTPEPTEIPLTNPDGPVIGISFDVPGIGSNGGNLKPLHPVRNVTLYLYPPDVNALDKRIRPVNTVESKAYYDSNDSSPTYTSFVNPKIDLGAKVQNGDYQIVMKTDQSYRILVKEKPDSVGGIIFSLEKRPTGEEYPMLPHQTMIMGDLFPPEGNNIPELEDYNVFIRCFHLRRGTPTCPNPTLADLNDDGVVNGLDYNIMVLSYKALQDQGITVPELAIVPTETNVSRLSYLTGSPTKPPKPKVTPTVSQTETKSSSGGIGGILLFLFFLILLGAGGFVLYLKNSKIRSLIQSFLPKSPTKPAQNPAQPNQAAPVAQTGQTAPAQNQSDQTLPPPAATAPTQTASASTSYYIKKQSEDDTKTGFWLSMTNDAGPTVGHYKGTDVPEGFAQVTGEMKTENGKTFMEITQITPEA